MWHLVTWPAVKLKSNWSLYIVPVTAFSSENKTKNKSIIRTTKCVGRYFSQTFFLMSDPELLMLDTPFHCINSQLLQLLLDSLTKLVRAFFVVALVGLFTCFGAWGLNTDFDSCLFTASLVCSLAQASKKLTSIAPIQYEAELSSVRLLTWEDIKVCSCLRVRGAKKNYLSTCVDFLDTHSHPSLQRALSTQSRAEQMLLWRCSCHSSPLGWRGNRRRLMREVVVWLFIWASEGEATIL